MNLVKIRVCTTSKKTADATGMVIRNNNSFRIVYFPKLVKKNKIKIKKKKKEYFIE